MNRAVIIAFFIVTTTGSVSGQEAEKNYEVVRESTSCDRLPSSYDNKSQALELISGANHRIEQNFKIRRQKGLKAGNYYSCDNRIGYLVIWIDDEYEIFQGVSLEDWEALIGSNDPEGVLLAKIRPNYPTIR